MTATLTRCLSKSVIKSSVSSYAGSLEYLKHFIPLAAMNIVYNRVTYDDSLYTKQKLLAVPYKTLRHGLPRKHVLFNFYYWLKDAIDSLDKKFLRDMLITFTDNKTDTVLEEYCFTITYNPDDDGKLPTGDAVIAATAEFLEQVNELGNEDRMHEEDVTMRMRLVLNEGAPKDFQLENYDNRQPFKDPKSKNYDVTIGIVSTGYHEMKVLGSGEIYRTLAQIASNIPVLNNPQETNNATNELLINNNTNIDSDVSTKRSEALVEQHESAVASIEANKENVVETNNVKQRSKRSKPAAQKKQPSKRSKRQIKATKCWDDFEEPKKVNKTRTSIKVTERKGNEALEEAESTITKRKKQMEVEALKEAGSTQLNRNEEVEKIQVEPEEDQLEETNLQPQIDLKDNLSLFSNFSSSKSESEPEKIQMTCICNIDYKFQSIEIVQCTKCTTSQHVACTGFKSKASLPLPYICLKCQQQYGSEIVDIRMNSVKDDRKRVFLALLRLVTLYCCKTKKPPQDIVEKVLPKDRLKIINHLVKLKVINEDKYGYTANIPLMEKQILNGVYFYTQINSQTLGNSCAISIEDENDSMKLT